MSDSTVKFGTEEQTSAAALITAALAEDTAGGEDVTSQALISESLTSRVRIVARTSGVLCGSPIGCDVLARVDHTALWTTHLTDGRALSPQDTIATLEGPVRSLLKAERTILNFMTHLSGIATLTHQFVEAVQGTPAVILDTRKTLPGWRRLQKFAVRCGGGTNHRMGLWDAVLIKDNHLAALAEGANMPFAETVRSARRQAPEATPIEIEVDTLQQLQDALAGEPDVILLDNMSDEQLREAVVLRNATAPRVLLEASGGVTLETVGAIAATGIDRISIGALTHSAPALDLAFDWPK